MDTAESSNRNHGFRLLVFAAVALSAYLLHWDLANVSWGIWLSEFAICSAVVCNLLWHICFSELPSESETSREDSEGTDEVYKGGRVASLLVVGFCAFCVFGMLSMYAMFLYGAFPVPVTKRPLTLVNLLLLGFETAVVLLPQHWTMVVGTLVLEKESYTGDTPEQTFHLFGSRNLMKIHFSLLLLPPLALAIKPYVSNYSTVIAVLLLFIFYFPVPSRRPKGTNDE